MSTPLEIDPVARWLLCDCALREARHAHAHLRDDRMALALVDAARALGPMDEKQEAEAQQVERWAGRVPPAALDLAA